jgi:hypothetical protein
MKKWIRKAHRAWIVFCVWFKRKRFPRVRVSQPAPAWGDGQTCEVLRWVRSIRGHVRKWTAARVDQINPRTIWVRFADGGVGKFKKERVAIR